MLETTLIGRLPDNTTDSRAACELVSSVSIPFEGSASGEIQGSRFSSTDSEDRGGCVLKISLENDASSFIPFAKNVDGGIEIHMAGDIEAKSFIAALRALLANDH